MSLFIAALAFGESPLLDGAKRGVLLGSLAAGVDGAVILARRTDPRPFITAVARTLTTARGAPFVS